MAQLVANLYPDLHSDLVPGAQGNISNHLQKLEEEMRISEFFAESRSKKSYMICNTVNTERHTVAGESRWTLTSSGTPKL